MELVDEVEKAKSEGGTGARPGGWKPPGVEELSAAVAVAVLFTEAVGDPHGTYTRDIEQHELHGVRGKEAPVANVMTKLVGEA